jgi:multidrug efflux pump subunit AcrA (membrane-fusion protein)
VATRLVTPQQLGEWFPPAAWFGSNVAAKRPAVERRAVPVEVATAVKMKTPVLIEALGTVTVMASVAVKTRMDDEITAIHFTDGAFVKQGDLLITLDSRATEAQIAQAQGTLARDQAQLDGAERDLRRNTDLMTKGAGPQLSVENSKTQTETYRAAIQADLAVLENLKVQLSYCTIRASITGRISQAAVKVGNFVRSADLTPIATINQMAPVYVTFAVPQRSLPELRTAIAEGAAPVEAAIPGESRRAQGTVWGEYGRSHDRHGYGSGRDAEQGRAVVAGHARQREGDGPHRGGRRGAVERGAGQPAGPLRVRGARQRRDRETGQGSPPERR